VNATVPPGDIRLITAAEAAQELKRRNDESKLLFYKPCCRPHKNSCPVLPCPESKHTKFHMSDKRIRIVFGGNRSGKSTVGLLELLFLSCFKRHPLRKSLNRTNARWRIYSSDFGIIEKLYLPLLREWVPKNSLAGEGQTKAEAFENSYDSRFHILRLKQNTTIDLMSYDQLSSKSESVELDGVLADEEMPEDTFAACMARLISRNGLYMMTVTPLYGITWAMKFLDSTDDQVEVFHFSIYDNPYNSDQAIKEFEDSIPEHEKEARLHGRFMELQGLVYKELRTDIHLLGDDQPSPENPVVCTVDPHPRKPTVVTWAYITPKGDVVFFDELEVAGSARDVAFAIRSKESQHPARTLLRLIDPAAKAQKNNLAFETDTLQEFEREGMGFTLGDNSDAGYNVVHEYLSYNPALPIGNFNRPRCFFTKNVPKTWYGMTHLLWDEWAFRKNMKDDKERIRDYKKDFPDCVRYTLAHRPTVRNLHMPLGVPIGNMRDAMNFNREKVGVRETMLGRTI
jgi:phage terminase large subunit-like protein